MASPLNPAEDTLMGLLEFQDVSADLFWRAVHSADIRLELTTICFSHYNEKARWMLSAAGESFEERGYMSFFHVFAVRALLRKFSTRGKRDKTGSPLATPVLAIYARSTGLPMLLLRSSTLIGRFAAARAQDRLASMPTGLGTVTSAALVGAGLYAPATAATGMPFQSAAIESSAANVLLEEPSVLLLERRFHDNLGTSARVVAYYFLVPRFGTYAQLAWNNASPCLALLHIVLYPLIALALWCLFGLSRAGYERGVHKLQAEFDAADSLLLTPATPGTAIPRLYLTGTSWTAADVTFAALAAPVLGISRTQGYGAWLPPLEAYPAELHALASSLRARPAGQLALRMYAQHRAATGTAM